MAKKPREGGAKSCVCSLCGAEAVSPPGKRHRRCSGNNGSAPKPKGTEKMPSVNRGTWT